jgi:hypothetical protein
MAILQLRAVANLTPLPGTSFAIYQIGGEGAKSHTIDVYAIHPRQAVPGSCNAGAGVRGDDVSRSLLGKCGFQRNPGSIFLGRNDRDEINGLKACRRCLVCIGWCFLSCHNHKPVVCKLRSIRADQLSDCVVCESVPNRLRRWLSTRKYCVNRFTGTRKQSKGDCTFLYRELYLVLDIRRRSRLVRRADVRSAGASDEGGNVRAASILLALVVVLGFAREAGAAKVTRDFTIQIGLQLFGLTDYATGPNHSVQLTVLHAGALGEREMPFTATQGLVGFCCILAAIIIVPVVLTVRWKKKRATS